MAVIMTCLNEDTNTPLVYLGDFFFTIDLFYSGGQTKYSFVVTLMIVTTLARVCKIQKNFCSKLRLI